MRFRAPTHAGASWWAPKKLAEILQAVCAVAAAEFPSEPVAHDVQAVLAQLGALPDAPLPLAATLLLCTDASGYVPAAVQSALLQVYGGPAVATRALACLPCLRDVDLASEVEKCVFTLQSPPRQWHPPKRDEGGARGGPRW